LPYSRYGNHIDGCENGILTQIIVNFILQ